MNPKQRRISARKILGVLTGLSLLAMGGFVLWINARVAHRAEAMDRRIGKLEALALSFRSRRAVLRGEVLSGSAWDDYTEAFKWMARVPPRKEALLHFVFQRDPSDREEAVLTVDSHSEALALLRRGVQRWEAGPHEDVVNDEAAINLELIALAKARLWEEAGRSRDAAELLLDLCQFNGDLGRSLDFVNELWSWSLSSVANENLRRVILRGDYSRDELARLESELEKLDVSSPTYGPSLLAYTAQIGAKDFRNADALRGWLSSVEVPWSKRWKYGFSVRVMLMDAFDHYADDAEKYASVDGQPWDRVVQLDRETSDRASASPNPVVCEQRIAGNHCQWRELQAQIRLLRAAVHFRRTGELQDLEDPLGTRLLCERKEGRVRIWSRGKAELHLTRPEGWGGRRSDNPLLIEIPE